MPQLRRFRVITQGEEEQKLEEFVANRLMEKIRKEEDSPIVRSNNDNQVLDNLGQKRRDIDTYMTEMEAKENATTDKEFELQKLDSPTSSRQQQQVTISSSYLSRILSYDDCIETVENNANQISNGDEQDERDGRVEELMRLVREKLQENETASMNESTSHSEKEDDKEIDESIGSIIAALANVKSAMSESQSVRSSATGDSNKHRRGDKKFRLLSPRMKSQNSPKSSISTSASTSSTNEKQSVFGNDVTHNNNLGSKLRYKLRSPKPPKSPTSKNVTTRKEMETASTPKTPTLKPLSISKPPLSPAPSSIKVSADSENFSPEGQLLNPTNKHKGTKQSENRRLLDIVSPETDSSCISSVSSTMTTPKPKREITEILQLTYSVAASTEAQPNEENADVFQSGTDSGNIGEGTEELASLEIHILSQEEEKDDDTIEFRVNNEKLPLSPIAKVAVESETTNSTTEDKQTKREINDILKWADESQVLEVNKTLTPKHVPKEGPAWGFINGNNRKKKNLRERASKAVKALRRGRGGLSITSVDKPRIVKSISSDHITTPSKNQSTNAPEKNVSDSVSPWIATLDELETHIKDAETGLASNLDLVNGDVFPQATSKLSTSHRVELLVIPLLDSVDTRETRETTSVACSRTTVPITNKCEGNNCTSPPQGPLGMTNGFGTKPAPIIEFEEEQLKAEQMHSFSSYESDPGEDTSFFSGSESHGRDEMSAPSYTPTSKKLFNNPVTRLEMSFSKSADSLDRKKFGSHVRSISDLSSVLMEETKAVADELHHDMKNMSKGWLCFL